MIKTLFITVLVEGAVVVFYSVRSGKPVIPISITSLFGNVFTQSLLWIVLALSFHHYLVVLTMTEIMIWGIESILLHAIPANQLKLKESALLSFMMNGTSMVLGWFLPV